MKPEDDLLADLKALAESDRELEAPARVEANLRAAFRHRAGRTEVRGGLRLWRWIPAIAAAATLVAVASYQRRASKPAAAVVAPAVARQVSPDARVSSVESGAMTQAVARNGAGSLTRVRKSAAPREITTEFFPLVEFAPPVEDGELMRVSLPASAMREVGLPVREDRLTDRVQADVFVSEGRATAIRFVKYTQ